MCPQIYRPRLSVVIPVYNERATIEEIIARVQAVRVEKEIVIVDDGSTDGTAELLQELASQSLGCDVWTGYKAFERRAVESVRIRENGFGFEPEVTAKIAKGRWRVYEVPVSYHGRTYLEGKKIHWKDGVLGLWCILRYNLFAGRTVWPEE